MKGRPKERRIRLVLTLAEEVVRSLKSQAALAGMTASELVTAWVKGTKEGRKQKD